MLDKIPFENQDHPLATCNLIQRFCRLGHRIAQKTECNMSLVNEEKKLKIIELNYLN